MPGTPTPQDAATTPMSQCKHRLCASPTTREYRCTSPRHSIPVGTLPGPMPRRSAPARRATRTYVVADPALQSASPRIADTTAISHAGRVHVADPCTQPAACEEIYAMVAEFVFGKGFATGCGDLRASARRAATKTIAALRSKTGIQLLSAVNSRPDSRPA